MLVTKKCNRNLKNLKKTMSRVCYMMGAPVGPDASASIWCRSSGGPATKMLACFPLDLKTRQRDHPGGSSSVWKIGRWRSSRLPGSLGGRQKVIQLEISPPGALSLVKR